ncbi:septal ring lytic transglycosylase RlpA family protein [Chondrinema litorale]|uniref:septal ring lytic transglycosylase RlpA family protein n=1 Tax=Chondrinema litorale TaxID=2994555 RepID=UPI0025437974|nr:septal ring lytic transglycosylase RlpA family protein [Chondrinema litorale]UZR92978.1 septal ring lytic transglycosylase RlpA family protein [Chondrinema litorale]
MKTILNSIILSIILGIIATTSFAQEKEYKVGYKEKGKASYYGEKLHGKTTANGEKYDMFSMTAAHPSIPFNSIIKVTNVNSPDKWVTLRINDRGPFTKNRILDISKKAALKLNMEKTGVLEVELEILKLGDNESLTENKKPDTAKDNETLANAKSAGDEKDKETKKNTDTKKPDTQKVEVAATEKNKDVKAKAETKPEEKAVATKKDNNKAKANANSSSNKGKDKNDKAVTASNNVPLNQRFSKTGTYNVWGTPVKPKGYGLQLGSYSEIDQAIKVAEEASNLGLKGIYIQSGWTNQQPSYRVLYGAWANQDEAKENITITKRKGFPSAFVKNHL